jgi:hypothetical protein
MIEQNSSPSKNQCVACLENIKPDARICPKCRSSQNPQRWQSLFSVLKWITGLTAVISLLIGVRQLSVIVKDWSERDKAVSQIVAASKMQMELKDYQAAWQIVKQATSIAPSSQKAFDQQVDVAMAWLQDVWRQKDKKTYTEIIDPLILTLARGAGDEDHERAADVLAHIGWANCLRLRDEKAEYEVDGYFNQALEFERDNTYANLFRGYWLINDYNKTEDDGSKLPNAMAHFSKALKTGENLHFVTKWLLLALTGSYVTGADVEAIKAANELRKLNKTVDPSAKLSVLGEFNMLRNFPFTEGSLLSRLLADLSVQEIKDTYLWLMQDKGNTSDDALEKELILGLMSEASGDLKSAFDQYQHLLNAVKLTSSSYRRWARTAFNRVLIEGQKKGGVSGIQIPDIYENTIVLSNQPNFGIELDSIGMTVKKLHDGPAKIAGMKAGDILLMVDGDPLENDSEFDHVKQEIMLEKRPYGELLLLRKNRLVRYRIMN